MTKLGALHLMCDSPVDKWPVTNRGIWRIDPARANGKNIFANYQEYFRGRVDPITNWLEGGATKESAVHDFERPFGSVGAWRQEWDIEDGLRARSEGKSWLEDFARAAHAHTSSGREIVCHMGGLELADWAALIRVQHSHGATADALRVVLDTCEPLVRAGVVIGVDAASASDANSADYGAVTLLRSLGAEVQIESTPALDAPWWKGQRVRMAWSKEFQWRHIEENKRWPKLGTPEFRDWYPGLRVSVFSHDFQGAGASFHEPGGAKSNDKSRKALVNNMAETSRMLIEGGCTVLWDASSCEVAVELGLKAKELIL
jgi:hypothetical protein